MDFTIKEREDILKACDILGKRLLNTDSVNSEYVKVSKRKLEDGSEVEDYGTVRAMFNGIGFGLCFGFIVRVTNYLYEVGDKYFITSAYVTRTFEGYGYDSSIESDAGFLKYQDYNSQRFNPKKIIVELEDKNTRKKMRFGVLDCKHIVLLPSFSEVFGL